MSKSLDTTLTARVSRQTAVKRVCFRKGLLQEGAADEEWLLGGGFRKRSRVKAYFNCPGSGETRGLHSGRGTRKEPVLGCHQ